MDKSLYQSILSRLSRIAPLFAKPILDEAINKKGKTPSTVNAIDLLEILRNEINPKLSRKKIKTNAMTEAGSGFFIFDKDKNITFMSPVIKKLSRDIQIDQNKLIEKFTEIGFCCPLEELSELIVSEIEIPELKQIFEVSTAPVFDHDMKIVAGMSFVRDITLTVAIEEEVITQSKKLREEIAAREKAQHELEINQAHLLQASKLASLGEMAGGIAHEINNPLSIIFNGVELIDNHLRRMDARSERIGTYLDKIKKSCNRIKGTVDAMRSLGRQYEAGSLQDYLLADIVNDVLALCQEKYISRGVQVELTNNCPDLKISCRPIELGQVLINLMNNSFDAISEFEEKWIKIYVNMNSDTEVRLSFVDSGNGIPESVQNKIFEPFFTTKPVGKGVGIGMSISKKIIEAHHGSIMIDRNHQNTKIDIVLPLR